MKLREAGFVTIVQLVFLSTLLSSCKEDEMNPAFRVEVDFETPIDSAYALVSDHIRTQKVMFEIDNDNGTAVVNVVSEADCADIEIYLFRQISEAEWTNEVSSVEITQMDNISTAGVYRVHDAQLEPEIWTVEHWFRNDALGGIQQRITISECEHMVALKFLSASPVQPYISFQYCVYDDALLIDCPFTECLECPLQDGEVAIPVYWSGSWCSDLTLRHEPTTYIFHNDIEVFLGYY